MQFLQKCYQNLVRNVRHCNKFAKFAVLVQIYKILVRKAKLARISVEFCKICDSCNLGKAHEVKLLERKKAENENTPNDTLANIREEDHTRGEIMLMKTHTYVKRIFKNRLEHNDQRQEMFEELTDNLEIR